MTPATLVRRVPCVDHLDRDGQRLVLLVGRAILVEGLGPSILDLTADPITLGELTALLVELHGAPPGSDAAALVAVATSALVDEGLVEQVSSGPRPRAAADPPVAGDPR